MPRSAAESHTVAQPRVEASPAQQRSRWVLFTLWRATPRTHALASDTLGRPLVHSHVSRVAHVPDVLGVVDCGLSGLGSSLRRATTLRECPPLCFTQGAKCSSLCAPSGGGGSAVGSSLHGRAGHHPVRHQLPTRGQPLAPGGGRSTMGSASAVARGGADGYATTGGARRAADAEFRQLAWPAAELVCRSEADPEVIKTFNRNDHPPGCSARCVGGC